MAPRKTKEVAEDDVERVVVRRSRRGQRLNPDAKTPTAVITIKKRKRSAPQPEEKVTEIPQEKVTDIPENMGEPQETVMENPPDEDDMTLAEMQNLLKKESKKTTEKEKPKGPGTKKSKNKTKESQKPTADGVENVEDNIAEPIEPAKKTESKAVEKPTADGVETLEDNVAEPIEPAKKRKSKAVEKPIADGVENVEDNVAEPIEPAKKRKSKAVEKPTADGIENVEDKVAEPVEPAKKRKSKAVEKPTADGVGNVEDNVAEPIEPAKKTKSKAVEKPVDDNLVPEANGDDANKAGEAGKIVPNVRQSRRKRNLSPQFKVDENNDVAAKRQRTRKANGNDIYPDTTFSEDSGSRNSGQSSQKYDYWSSEKSMANDYLISENSWANYDYMNSEQSTGNSESLNSEQSRENFESLNSQQSRSNYESMNSDQVKGDFEFRDSEQCLALCIEGGENATSSAISSEFDFVDKDGCSVIVYDQARVTQESSFTCTNMVSIAAKRGVSDRHEESAKQDDMEKHPIENEANPIENEANPIENEANPIENEANAIQENASVEEPKRSDLGEKEMEEVAVSSVVDKPPVVSTSTDNVNLKEGIVVFDISSSDSESAEGAKVKTPAVIDVEMEDCNQEDTVDDEKEVCEQPAKLPHMRKSMSPSAQQEILSVEFFRAHFSKKSPRDAQATPSPSVASPQRQNVNQDSVSASPRVSASMSPSEEYFMSINSPSPSSTGSKLKAALFNQSQQNRPSPSPNRGKNKSPRPNQGGKKLFSPPPMKRTPPGKTGGSSRMSINPSRPTYALPEDVNTSRNYSGPFADDNGDGASSFLFPSNGVFLKGPLSPGRQNLKGILKNPYTCDSCCECKLCRNVRHIAQNAINFSRHQMKDTTNVVGVLLEEISYMREAIVECMNRRGMSPRPNADGLGSVLTTSTRAEKAAKVFVAEMQNECNQFCQLAGLPMAKPKGKKRIKFADDLGEDLVRVRYFEKPQKESEE